MNALSVQKLSLNFGGVQALRDVSLKVPAGERRLIIGPNGAGKTTLFNVIAGIYGQTIGTIHLFGEDISDFSTHERAALGLARTFQITNLFSGMSVFDNVLIALLAKRGGGFNVGRALYSNKALIEEANSLLQHWGLSDLASQPASVISYGQKRQLDLIIAMATQPKVLLLDEPMAGLSAAEVIRVTNIILALPTEMTVVMIEHDMEVAFSIADQITVLQQGKIVAEGGVSAIKNNELVNEIYLGEE